MVADPSITPRKRVRIGDLVTVDAGRCVFREGSNQFFVYVLTDTYEHRAYR